MWVIVISISVIILTLSFLCYLQRVWHFEDLKDVSKICMWPLPIIMDATKVRNSREMVEFLLNMSKKEAKRYKFSIGFDNYLVLLRSEDIKIVLNSQELLSKGKDYKLMERFIGQSLLTSTGKCPFLESWLDIIHRQKWAQRKKMLTPTFNLSIIRDFVPTFEAIGDVLIEILEEKSNGNPIDVVKIFELFTLDVFYDMLLKSTIDGVHLNIEEVREEVDMFMVAGRDTNATTLSFALYCLAQHPKVQQKLFREQKEIFGDKSKDVHATFDDFKKMNYLEMVIKEVLRLYTPLPVITREAKTNIAMEFGILKKGLQIMLSPMVTHRNPEYFPEPEKFDPERFSPKNLDKIKPFTYIPFSHGYRNCIDFSYVASDKFAMISLKLALSKIVRNFKFHPDITYEPILVYEVLLKSKNGVRVIIEKRV